MSAPLPDILTAAHQFISRALAPGDVAIDATVGNGHDTVFLSEQVGEQGTVFGFDVQDEAIQNTRQKLQREGVSASVTLVHDGHEHLTGRIPESMHGTVGAVMFNLGYLPGSDSDCITRPETTLPALRSALELLRPDGLISVVAYPGHDGGRQETNAVEQWASERPRHRVNVMSYRFVNHNNDSPHLILFHRHT